MKHITTPVLCMLLGVVLVFAALLQASGASAESWGDDEPWDGDDRPGYRQSAWHPHEAYRDGNDQSDERWRGPERTQGHHRDLGEYGAPDDREGNRSPEADRPPLDIRSGTAAVWRNPQLSPEPAQTSPPQSAPAQTASIPSPEAGAGPCREYTATARIAGRDQQIYGRACRQPDGAWKFEPK